MTYERPAELSVEPELVAPEDLATGSDDADAQLALPEGIGAEDSSAMVMETPDRADAGFGEVVAVAEIPEAEERVAIPSQPGGNLDEVVPAEQTPAAGVEAPTVVADKPAGPEPAADTVRARLNQRVQEVREGKHEAEPAAHLGHGPYYGWLRSEGDAGAALVPYLDRLTVQKDDYVERSELLRHYEGDDLEKGLAARLSDEDGAQGSYASRELTAILGHSLQELKAHPELCQDGNVNWLGLGTALLDKAAALDKNPDPVERRGILSSAATAALMAENPDDRIAFLEQTAERGLGHRMTRALTLTDVSVIMPGYRNDTSGGPDRSFQRLARLSSAFEVAPEDLARYHQLVDRDLGEPVDAHAAMQDAVADYTTFGGMLNGGHAATLEDSSISPKYVDRYHIDPTKAERFALEEVFVQAQMDELFPGGDTTRFRNELAAMRPNTGDAYTELAQLISSTQAVIRTMSTPAVERFEAPFGAPNDSWTRQELAAWRYNQLALKGRDYDNLARFVDPSIAGRTNNFAATVYGASVDGAALPMMAAEAIRNVMDLAEKYRGAKGDRVTPEEMRDLAQTNRRQLMKLAAINLDHFRASLTNGSIGTSMLPGMRQPAAMDETEMVRRPDGRLDLTGPLFKPEDAPSQAAARLACVALRVNVEGVPEEDDATTRGKTNSIELLTKIFFDEAYERGILRTDYSSAA